MCELVVHDVDVPRVTIVSTLPEHSINLVRSPVVGGGTWQGSRMAERTWLPGSVSFLPAMSEISVEARSDHHTSLVLVKESVFHAAARDHVDYGRIDLHFRDITSPAVTHLANCVTLISRDPEMRAWPLLTESSSLALAVAALKELSPIASRAFDQLRVGPSANRRRRVLEYIDANLHRQITLDELAAVAGRSKYHFVRNFTADQGMSPLRYLMLKRTDAAKRMLRGGTESLAQVAMACGFASQSHMTTVFKKVVGATPGKYRRGVAGAAVAWLAERALAWLEPLACVAKMA